MEPVELREGGLLLRPWRAEDAEAVFQACQDAQIQRWTMVPRPYRMQDAVGFVTQRTEQEWAAGTGAPLGVFDQASGMLLGATGLVSLDRTAGVGEIGYWTAPWARGQGVAADAARAVVRFGQNTLGLRRIVWRAEVGNHASRLVAARIGVRFEGVARAGLPTHDGLRDGWVGAVLAGELREADAPVSPALARAVARCHAFGQPQPTLTGTTGRGATVRLRPLRSDDIPACIRACNDPESVRFTTVPHPYQLEDAVAFVHEVAPAGWARGVEAIFAVADADDSLVGTMALRLSGDELTTPHGDVGYLMGPWARGQGYASAALRLLVDWGVRALALHRIEWRAYVGNTASRQTAQRAGFRVEGEQRQVLAHRGEYVDAWIGARLASDPA